MTSDDVAHYVKGIRHLAHIHGCFYGSVCFDRYHDTFTLYWYSCDTRSIKCVVCDGDATIWDNQEENTLCLKIKEINSHIAPNWLNSETVCLGAVKI
jgi:hypothetical protein